MMATNDHSEFISENVQKFHDLINSPELDTTILKDTIGRFYDELFIRASESNGYDGHIIYASTIEIDILAAIFMSAIDIYARFCDEYDKLYPDEVRYLGRDAVLRMFRNFIKGKVDDQDEIIEPDEISILPATPMNAIFDVYALQGKDDQNEITE